MKGCICFEQSLSCTDLCPCQAGDLCRYENTHLAISRNTDEDEITTVLFSEIDGDWMKKKKIEIICHHLHQYF
jgi:hypothetical protein